MSSWLVSLLGIGGSVTRWRRRLEKRGLRAPCILNCLFNAGPWRLVAEPRAQIAQQRRSLRIGHAGGKSRHDRAAFTFDSLDAGQHDIGEIARIWANDRGAERQIDPTIRQRPPTRVT